MPKNTREAKDFSVMMVTKEGIAKKVSAESFYDVRRSGIIAIKLNGTDQLISADFVEKGDSISVVTRNGQSIRFKDSDIREMGRGAAGVRAIKLGKEDSVVRGLRIRKAEENNNILVFTQKGYGKQTSLEDYKIQKRGGSGIKTAKITSKNGAIVNAVVVNEETDEIVAMSKKGQVIRVDVDEIPILGRQTQGVRVMKLRAGDEIATLVTF
jgi:DNA gyrase subunit A